MENGTAVVLIPRHRRKAVATLLMNVAVTVPLSQF